MTHAQLWSSDINPKISYMRKTLTGIIWLKKKYFYFLYFHTWRILKVRYWYFSFNRSYSITINNHNNRLSCHIYLHWQSFSSLPCASLCLWTQHLLHQLAKRYSGERLTSPSVTFASVPGLYNTLNQSRVADKLSDYKLRWFSSLKITR